ncbi:hypothetical protein [Leptothermofonsia sp. ETS-13]|uniref:hypothetical protein n=1 Tax=Leptothermofonsia sp. ETS-13 TaxID=3035696 RepID=UPI003B9F472C
MDSFSQNPAETSPAEGISISEGISASPEIIQSPDDLLRRIGLEPSAIGFSGKIESRAEMEARLRREEIELNARLEKENTERVARLEKERLDDSHKRALERYRFLVKEASVYVIGILLIIALGSTSSVILFDKSASEESKTWARSTLTAIATAVAGYVFGKSSSSTT